MPEQVRIEGTEQLTLLSRKLREVGDRTILPAMRRGINAGTKDMRRKVRDRIRASLPQAGGLARWAGSMPSTSVHAERDRASIKVKLAKRDHDLVAMNRGTVRHPVFGHRTVWVKQPIKSGWFEDAIEPEGGALAEAIATEVRKAIQATIDLHGKAVK